MTETGIETGVKTEQTPGYMQQGNDREVSHSIFIIVLAMYVNGLVIAQHATVMLLCSTCSHGDRKITIVIICSCYHKIDST